MNKLPEQFARDAIDQLLTDAGWTIQDYKEMNLKAASGVAVREYLTKAGPADYVLFVDMLPVGIIEAKREEEGHRLTIHESQSTEYAGAKLRFLDNDPLPFVYESTGSITHFTNNKDPKPRARSVFSFHRPETLLARAKQSSTLRERLRNLPALPIYGLRDCQITAITNLEQSFKEGRPKALIQMATGSGKTFTAITAMYRLFKYAGAKRILFLVDTKNLGEQAEQELMSFVPNDDNRKFTELYGVTRLKSSFIPNDSQVYISTIQRMYSILKGTELDERDEEQNPNESFLQPKEPMPVVYNEKVPMEFFDFIVIDECHRSIYNLWRQVLDYFDAFQVGLTATPDNRTFGYFNQNVVSDYGYEKAVIDGVLVPYNVFTIRTEITQKGSRIALGEQVDMRQRLTRRKFWETMDEDLEYKGKQLDKEIVNPSTIRTIVAAVKQQLPVMFPDRYDGNGQFEVPKTLIFAKSDSHAEDIIEIVREEFGEENKFCKKITYRSAEDPKSVLSQFRNDYYPRIAVTVDMIATGTDIRPLEVLVFMRDVKSRSYYEQMKGRGTRTCSLEELRATGTPSAKLTKDHFVIIDAIGVESSQKTDSRPLEKKPGVSLGDLLQHVAVGNTSEELLTTLANRLLRLEKQLNEKERKKFQDLANGSSINQAAGSLLHAYDPDMREGIAHAIKRELLGEAPARIEENIDAAFRDLTEKAVALFHNPDLRQFIIDVRKKYDQVIDNLNPDSIIEMGWQKDQRDHAAGIIADFQEWISLHKDEVTALQIFYGQPYRRRELTYRMVRELYEKLLADKPSLAPLNVWRAYAQLEKAGESPKNELIALVSLVRNLSGWDDELIAFDKKVDLNFQGWAFQKQAGSLKFTEEQMDWLRMIKDHIAGSFHLDTEDFELSPFNGKGGLGKFYRVFGEKYESVVEELNEVLVA